MRRHPVTLALILVATLGLPLSPAAAQLGSFTDADDTQSRLDLAAVRLRFNADSRRYTVRLTTIEPMRLKRGGTLVVLIDSVGGHRWDYRLYIWNDSGSSGIFCDRGARAGAGDSRFEVVGWHPARRFVWCRFEGIRRTKTIRWRTFGARGSGRPFGRVVDRAPDGGWF